MAHSSRSTLGPQTSLGSSSNSATIVFFQIIVGLVALVLPATIWAAGVVSTGTPESCTQAALDEGGVVTFDCEAEPVTITMTMER